MTPTEAHTADPCEIPWSWSDGRPADPAGLAGRFTVTAPEGSDLYSMPGVREIDTLMHVGRDLSGDFTLSVHAEVRPHPEAGAFADAGGVLVHTTGGWAKFCVERSATGNWRLVTVVSMPYSDEAAGAVLDEGPRAELILVREGRRTALLHRPDPDGEPRFVRTFTVPEGPLRVALFAQAPFSPSCTAVFDRLRIAPEPLRDRR